MNRNRLLMLPLVALVVASAVLIIAGILAWGAAAEVSYNDWVPTFAGVFVGGFLLIGAAYCLGKLRQRISQPYRTRAPLIFTGATLCLLLIIFALISAATVGDPARYRTRFDEDPTVVTSFEDPSLEPRGFVVAIVLICFPGPVAWLLYGVKRFYVEAIDPVSSDVKGLDPMGQIMGSA